MFFHIAIVIYFGENRILLSCSYPALF